MWREVDYRRQDVMLFHFRIDVVDLFLNLDCLVEGGGDPALVFYIVSGWSSPFSVLQLFIGDLLILHDLYDWQRHAVNDEKFIHWYQSELFHLYRWTFSLLNVLSQPVITYEYTAANDPTLWFDINLFLNTDFFCNTLNLQIDITFSCIEKMNFRIMLTVLFLD